MNDETSFLGYFLSILSVLASAFIASYLTHRFAITQMENERRNALKSSLLIIIQELKDAREKFERYEEAENKGFTREFLTVAATGYEGLKINGLIDMLPVELHYKIYNLYLILESINKTADLLNQAYLLEKPESELLKFRNIIGSYYKLGLREVELIKELERFINEVRKHSVICFFEAKTWEEVRNEILFKKLS